MSVRSSLDGRKTKKSFFANTGNSPKHFWKAIKPYFGGKNSVAKERILLVEGSSVISNEKELASIFNSFFNTATDSLEIPEIPGFKATTDDPVSAAILKFQQHPFIVSIKNRKKMVSSFELEKISRDTMMKEIVVLI